MCIARALANRPNVLLLDEPTSALDRTAARNIIELICNLNRQLGLTVIIVTHVMEHAQAVATRVAMLVGGVLIEEGAAADFFESPKTQIGHRFLKGELTEDGR
jgi:D-methionine transport system ATP-binding protein